eukprot:6335298-Amphidinium_carterae.1
MAGGIKQRITGGNRPCKNTLACTASLSEAAMGGRLVSGRPLPPNLGDSSGRVPQNAVESATGMIEHDSDFFAVRKDLPHKDFDTHSCHYPS